MCKFAESLALNKLGTSIGKESFWLAWKMSVNDISDYCIENSVTEEFESLVVQFLAFKLIALSFLALVLL